MIEIATFYLNGSFFGIPMSYVREIIRNIEYTHVELTAEYVTGLMNLRGQIITLLDFGVKFGYPKREITKLSRCIVLKKFKAQRENESLSTTGSEEMIGLVVDRVGDIMALDESKFESPPANIDELDGSFLDKVVTLNDQLLMLLNLKKILSQDKE